MEYDIALCYLDNYDNYLPKKGNILEIGAATGRYTSELARRSYSVTAVDISAQLLDLSRSKISWDRCIIC
ncbi:MAG: class I SAM-dependent methyltransferase [Candidatus Hydrogenedentes bacterium]|nr:class I SAM-dependent methyltransferase [Candidatus Hydrogenedentota bacterium]